MKAKSERTDDNLKQSGRPSGTSLEECLLKFDGYYYARPWATTFSKLVTRIDGWFSTRCQLEWKVKATRFDRLYFKLQVSALQSGENTKALFPTVVGSDGTRGGETVTSRSKTRPSGQTYSASLSDLAKSGLLPTPTTGSNRNSRNAVQKIGEAHQHHGIALGLSQVLEISTGILPKEFDSWEQVPQFYRRLLPTPTVREYKGGRSPVTLDLAGRSASNTLGDTINAITGRNSRLNALFVLEMMGFPVHWTLMPFLKSSIG
jgi:hypothetical protein